MNRNSDLRSGESRFAGIADQREFQAKIVAFLSAAGWAQKQIADTLTTSQSCVSRLLQEARDARLLVTICRLDPRECQLIQAHLFPERQRLWEHLASLQPAGVMRLRQVSVFPSGIASKEVTDADRLAVFATFAARRLEEAICDSKIVGVAWGRTISAIAPFCESRDVNGSSFSEDGVLFPLCGTPYNRSEIESCASKNVSRLCASMSLDPARGLSLSSIPARLPKSFNATRIRASHVLFNCSDAYRRIFTGKSAYLLKADCMLLSGGTLASRHSDDPIIQDLLTLEEIPTETLSRVSHGDVAGALISRNQVTLKDRRLLSELAMRWNGVTCEQISACAERSAKGNAVGVVLFACGVAKLDVVLEAVRRGLVNELIIDETLATALIARSI